MEKYYKILKISDWESVHTKQWLLDLQKSIKINKRALDMIGTLNGKFLLSMEKETFKFFDKINVYNQSIEDNKELFLKYLNLKTGERIIISDSKLDTKSIGKNLFNLYQTNNKLVLYVNCKGDFECTNKNLEKSLKLLYTNETNQRLALPSDKKYFSKLIFCLLRNNVNVILNEFHQLDNIPKMIYWFSIYLDIYGSAQNGPLFVLSSDKKKMINIISSERNLYMKFFSITTE
ncbi:hypothetical protein ACTFIW_005277 [Dictyostelium discoideum]